MIEAGGRGNLPPGAARRRRRRGRRRAGHRRRHSARVARADAARHPRHAVAARRAAGRRRRPAVPGRRHPDRLVLHRAARARRPRGVRRRPARREAAGQVPAPAAGPARLGARGDPRLLEDLPARRAARSRCIAIRPIEPTSAGPAFTCPCHYSTFSPGEGGRLIFGPAGRALPQLPLMIDSQGYLRAAGPFHEDIGPSWWNVHRSRVVNLLERMLHRRLVRAGRAGTSSASAPPSGIKAALRYVFPDHWSFLLGEIALYSFIVLVGTGIFLTLYYIPGDSQVIYHGSVRAAGRASRCRRPTARCSNLSFNVPAGPADAPGPPLGRRRVHRRDRAAPVPDLLHRRLPQAARPQLLHRPD